MNKTSGYDMSKEAISTERALKLALEALKRMKRYGNTFGYRSHEQNPYEQVCEAIIALEALAEQPAPVAEPRKQEPIIKSYLGKDISAPDHLTYDEPETREYINGWNDFRQAMLESLRKPT